MPRNWAASLCSSLSLDLRSLALLRAGIAAVLAIDALCRVCSAGLLYADSGWLPRAAALVLIDPARVSLHGINGHVAFATLLTLLQFVAGIALLLGWRTRIATALCWLLAVSAAGRNPLVVTAGDGLAIALLSWGMFLPWNARWSVDAALSFAGRAQTPAYFSLAGAALLLQVLSLPLLCALALTAHEWHADPGALHLALSQSADAHAPGTWLLAWPGVLAPIETLLWWALLSIAPLALLPGLRSLPRRAALLLALPMCAFVFASFSAGTLPWLLLCTSALLIDPALWDRLSRARVSGAPRIYFDGESARSRRTVGLLREFLCVPATTLLPAQDSPRVTGLMLPGKSLVVIDGDDSAHLDGEALTLLLRRSPLLRPLRPILGPRLADVLLRVLLRCAARDPGADRIVPALGAGRYTQWAAVVLALAVLLAQLSQLRLVPGAVGVALHAPLTMLGLDHLRAWPASAPTGIDRWIAVPGEGLDGRELDALWPTPRAAYFGRDQRALLPGARGRAYELRLLEPGADIARAALAQRACAQHEGLARLRVVQMVQPLPAQSGTVEQRVLLRHDCM